MGFMQNNQISTITSGLNGQNKISYAKAGAVYICCIKTYLDKNVFDECWVSVLWNIFDPEPNQVY